MTAYQVAAVGPYPVVWAVPFQVEVVVGADHLPAEAVVVAEALLQCQVEVAAAEALLLCQVEVEVEAAVALLPCQAEAAVVVVQERLLAAVAALVVRLPHPFYPPTHLQYFRTRHRSPTVNNKYDP